MITKLTNRSICLALLCGWASYACALSLGSAVGSTVLGRPLDLVVPIQFDDSAQGNGSGCVAAQVHYGDRRVERTRVQLDLHADAARQLSYARITSPSLVDEPFVTVVLQAGCGRHSTRRYVLLAEAPPAVAAALVSDSRLAAAGLAREAPVAGLPVPQARAARAGPGPGVGRGGAASTVAPVANRRTPALARDPASRGDGRLQLAVWEPGRERLPWLRVSSHLLSTPTTDAAHRAAASSLWRALNAQPEELLRTAERLRGLESEMVSLSRQSARHRAEISAARETLQAAQTQRHVSLVLTTLLALIAGGSAACLWHRFRGWRRSLAAPQSDSWYGSLDPFAHPVPVAKAPPEVARVLPPVEAPAAAPSPAQQPPSGTQQGIAVASRASLKVDALHGAQQQSEFFASLGQVDEAVAALTTYLEESSEQPVLGYLELFSLYHCTGMRTEFEQLQTVFRQAFGLDVAGFSHYQDDLRELEFYPVPLNLIASAWPSVRSQDIIEDLLFEPPATPGELLSLQAYRELLWLYTLAEEVACHTGMPAGLQLLGNHTSSNDHFILPWIEGEPADPAEMSLDQLDRIDVAPQSNAFAVDIDLTALEGHPGYDVVRVTQDGPASGAASKPEPAPAGPADPYQDAFDSAMGAQSRRPTR